MSIINFFFMLCPLNICCHKFWHGLESKLGTLSYLCHLLGTGHVALVVVERVVPVHPHVFQGARRVVLVLDLVIL